MPKYIYIILIICCSSSSLFYAEELEESDEYDWQLSGYLTLGYTNSDKYSNGPTFKRNITQDSSRIEDQPWRTDSRLGLQVNKKFSANWDFVGQVLLRDRLSDGSQFFLDSIEMAFIRYQNPNGFTASFGRIPLSNYALSDHRNVGYSYHWVRPPVEFYGWVPYYNYDGTKFEYDFGDWDSSWHFEAFIGRSEVDLWSEYDDQLETDYIAGLGMNWQNEHLKLGASVTYFEYKGDLDVVNDAESTLLPFSGIWPGIQRNIDSVNLADSSLLYLAVSAEYTKNNYFVISEVSYTDSNDKGYQSYRAYISLAKRIGKWQPHITLSKSWDNIDRIDDITQPTFPVPALTAAAERLRNQHRAFVVDQQTLSLGVRYDFRKDMALKFQWDITQIENDARGIFHNSENNESYGSGTYNWYSVALEWVF